MKLTDYTILRDGNKSQCPICSQWFSKFGLPSHFHRTHNPEAEKYIHNSGGGWNKGQTKKTDKRIATSASKVSAKMKGRKGLKPSAEHRAKTSESMKRAHAEGRAHNIGSSRWNNEPSYPEKFFMRVIENEFGDKNYIQEFSFKRFSLDFAWLHKQKCIEIDGEQHQRFPDYQERDNRKDEALENAGWKILRISWKEMYSNPKYWIKVANDFIHDN